MEIYLSELLPIFSLKEEVADLSPIVGMNS